MSRKKKGDSILEHRVFWLVLAVVMVLPLLGVFTGMFTAELSTTGKAYQTVSYKPAGEELHFEVKNIKGVKELTAHFVEDAKNMLIEFEEVNTVSWGFEGTVYSQFKVFSEDASNIGEVEFVLKIKEADLDDLGLSGDDVNLYLEGQEWGTELTDLEGEYVFYEAKGEGMGEFVIGKAAEVEVEEVIEEVVLEVAEEEELEVEEEPVIEQPAPIEENWTSKIFSFFKNLFN